MDEITQHNAALVEQLNGAIAQTESQSAEIDRLAETFRLAGTPGVKPAAEKAASKSMLAASRSNSSVQDMRDKISRAASTFLHRGNAAVEEDWHEF